MARGGNYAGGKNLKLNVWVAIAGLLLINRLQFFSGFEAHGLAWWNRNFRPRARIAPDPGFSRTHVEDAKTPQLNTIAAGERLLHALENRLHSQFGLGLGNAGFGHHFVDNVELNH